MLSGWDESQWERIWMRAQARSWRTIAVVPCDERVSSPSFDVAQFLMGVGAHLGDTIGLADFRDVRLVHASAFLEVAAWHVDSGERLVFAMRSIAENPASVRFAQAADCAILCVSLGETSIAAVRDTIEQVGRDRFVGSLIVKPARVKPSKSTSLAVRDTNQDHELVTQPPERCES